jgi:hypothetical protein
VTFGAVIAASPANAATTDITGLTITPTAAATSTGGNTCQDYTVTETGSSTGGTITVNLQPTGAIDSEFCSPTLNPGAGNGTLDSTSFTTATNTVTFGVKEANATPAAGTVAITAFPSNTTTTPGAITATANQTFVSATSQDNIVTKLAATPATQTVSEGQTGVKFTVTATNGANVVEGATNITGVITSSQNNPTGQAVSCGAATDANGQVTCTATAPTSSTVQSGPYTVTFSIPSTQATAPATSITTTAMLTTAPAAAATATVALTCGTATTERTANNACVEPLTGTSETIAAKATTPAATAGGAAVPAAGVVVTFSSSAGGTVNPGSCVTGADGTCTTTLTITTPTQGSTITVTGTLSNSKSDTATVKTDSTFAAPATNITASAASPTAATGASDVVTAQVDNQFGNASGANTQVFFTVTGGTFSNGTTSQTATTDLSGKAQVPVSSAAAGTATVTTTLQPGTSSPNCSSPADPTTGAAAGNCSATATIAFTGGVVPPKKTVEKPTLTVTSPSKGHIHLSVTTHPSLAGKSVHFYRVTASGKHVLLGSKKTGSGGKASFTVKLTKGKTYKFDAKVVSLSASKYTSKYSAGHSKKVKK